MAIPTGWLYSSPYSPKGAASPSAGGPFANFIAAHTPPAPAAATGLPSTTPGTFNVNPPPQAGQGAYGAVPGPISVPPNLYQGVESIYPGLAGATGNAANLIASQMRGEFTPETESSLWNIANTYGVASGMPGAGLWSNKFMGNVAGAKEALQQQGLQNLNTTTGNLSHMVTDPNLAASIAARNALMASAPNPAEAVAAQLAQYYNALTAGQNRGYNPAGGTGAHQPLVLPPTAPLGPTPHPLDPNHPMGPTANPNAVPTVNTSNDPWMNAFWRDWENSNPVGTQANQDAWLNDFYDQWGQSTPVGGGDPWMDEFNNQWDQSTPYDPNAELDNWLP